MIEDKTVCIILPSLYGGGAEKVGVNIANELVKKGWNVVLLVVGKGRDYIELVDYNVKLILLNSKIILSFIKIYKVLKNLKIKKILCFSIEIAAFIYIYKSIFGFKATLIGRSMNILSEYSKDLKLYWRILNKSMLIKLFIKADKIIAQSVAMKDDMVKNFKVKSEKIVIINNPSVLSQTRVSKQHYLEDEDFILFVGRFTKQKNLPFLIQGYAELVKERQITQKLYLIGKGNLLKEISQLIRYYKLEEMVKIVPFTTDIYNFYKSAKVTVLTSFYEGFSNVLLESISMGTPIIAFDKLGGVEELIIEGINGFKVNYLDKKDLKIKLLLALTYKWDKQSIIKTAEKFNIDKIVNKYEEVLVSC
ncbi:MAG: glycosyltransferase [Elusimicrobiales bacterium]|nr:glycosyltransferase [Elusimicrobiales bacterium]